MPNRQLHIQLDDDQCSKFRLAIKKLGYENMSQYLRQKVNQAIVRAENLNVSEDVSNSKDESKKLACLGFT